MEPIKFPLLVYMVMLTTGLFAHVQAIPALLSVSGRDAWLTIISTALPMVLWLLLLRKLLKLIEIVSVTEWKQSLSAIRYYLLVGPFIVYLLLMAYVTTKDIVIWSHISYIPDINYAVIVIVFLFLCFIGTQSGIQSLAVLSGVLLPFVVVLGFFVMAANTKKKDYELLLPILENGYSPVLDGIIYSLLPLIELFIILFVPYVNKQKITLGKLFIIGGIILGLMMGPTIGAITEFGPMQASEFRYPAFEQWRILTIGNYFSHVDFFAIYQWLSGGVLRTSLYVLLASQLIARKGKNQYSVLICYLFLIALCLYRIDQQTFYEMLYVYFMPISLGVLILQLLILCAYLIIQSRKKQLKEAKING
ncbi:endospore germination permease [Metabacillus litoralis]|uniref:endospore germination permease n=1 Tax=Metabacillus litoralis TaxID=152268 RepID=UPI00203AB656|nr:endospore germination permease [Metabacillus litoralis]MCM3161613.1 endospore germination permease [Metabacillus litoralis]MCM3412566.1 endospore germination permease [Metabacillus litoralis]